MDSTPQMAKPTGKSLTQSTESIYKGVQALGLRNLDHAFRFNDRNVDNLLKRRASETGVAETATEADDMRIDSDDIHNHYYQQKEGMSSLAKLVAVGLAATGFGIPASIAAWNLPSILGAKDTATSTVQTPAVDEGESDQTPVINIGGKEYELGLEP